MSATVLALKPYDWWELPEVLELLDGVETIGDALPILLSELPEDQYEDIEWGFTALYADDALDRERITTCWNEFVEVERVS